ncbi:hypothetical protein RUND412_000476 [Rhizina undulata]
MAPAASPSSSPSEKRLRAMAKRANSPKKRPFKFSIVDFIKTNLLLLVVATASYVSQLTLSPVYGEIPSSLSHSKISVGVFVVAWTSKYLLRNAVPRKIGALLPVLALYIPTIQRYIFRFSETWGAENGPIFTEAVTFYPLLFLSVLYSAVLLDVEDASLAAIAGGASYSVFWLSKAWISNSLPDHIGSSWFLTRCGLSNLIGLTYALISPSLLLLTAVPALLHTASMNSMCVVTPELNQTLLLGSNYTLIARQESITGYISVLENNQLGIRVLRCDHSLLGGEWVRTPTGWSPPPGFEHTATEFKEPIYAIFVIMEAVRLIDPPPKNENPRALAIGLGIGTSADGLIKHGVETDIVELDPVVYQYAKEYFGLHENHTAYIEDAVGFIKRESEKVTAGASGANKYEYILHDVFTGGAVPASLFTLEVFNGLRNLLAEDGVIAINWAGDLKLKAARSIIETVRTVFHNCRVFREELPAKGEHDVDFTNMVMFCTRSAKPYVFRGPTMADYLGSVARLNFLFPRYEINLEEQFDTKESFTLLDESNIGNLVDWQRKSAVGHWGVIRTVIPPVVWENY